MGFMQSNCNSELLYLYLHKICLCAHSTKTLYHCKHLYLPTFEIRPHVLTINYSNTLNSFQV